MLIVNNIKRDGQKIIEKSIPLKLDTKDINVRTYLCNNYEKEISKQVGLDTQINRIL